MRKLLFLSTIFCLPFANAQLVVNNTMTPQDLVQNVLLGAGVSVSNITFNGMPGNVWSEQAGEFNSSLANVGITNGVILATGDVDAAIGPNNTGSFSLGGGNMYSPLSCDADLQLLDPNVNGFNDCAVLEFDFIPTGDSIKFNFVFASEEYLEFVNSINDAFGFFISGPGFNGPYANNAENIALVPGTATPITINTVNDVVNSAYYVDNGDGFTGPFNIDPFYIQYDGLTVVMTAEAEVICGQTYHIKIAVADANDTAWDSAVFLEAGSFTSSGQVNASLTPGAAALNDSTILEGCINVELEFHRFGDTTNIDTINLVVTGTATAGVDYSPPLPSQLIFQPGDTVIVVSLNVPIDADGVETIEINIAQNIICSGQQVQNDYTFYIEQPPPLVVNSNDITIACGQVVDIGVAASGGFGFYQYVWDDGQTTDSITVAPDSTTTYYISVIDSCNIGPVLDTITVTVPVYPPVSITVTPDTAIPCLQNADLEVLTVSGGNGSYSYAWSDGLNPLGNTNTINVTAGPPTYYYVVVTDGCGDMTTDSILTSTQVLPPIVVTTNGNESPLCPGDTVDLMVTSVTGGNGVYTYAWTQQGQVISTASAISVGVPSSQVYLVTVEDQCGNVGTASATTTLPIITPLSLDLTQNAVICLGDSMDIYVWVDGGSGVYSIEWTSLLDANGNTFTDPITNVAPSTLTWYPVTVTDACGEVATDSMLIFVEDLITDIVVTQPGQDDVELFAASEPPGSTFIWDMGDGTRYRGDQIYHSYLNLEEHWVTLIVETPNGCIDTSMVLIVPPAHLYFPNAFTPDGDGDNDLFGPKWHDLYALEMTIFDRWGQEVFTTKDPGVLWDGRGKGGNAMPQGVYVYKFRASGHLLPAYEGIGHVTLLR